jgi:DNA ligase-1
MDSQIQPGSGSPALSEFAELCQQLSDTGSKLAKRALIAAYLRRLDARHAGLAVLYLTGAPFAATDPRQLNLGGALLSRALEERTGAGKEELHAAYLRHGDLGDAAFDILTRQAGERGAAEGLTLAQLDSAFAAIAAQPKPAAKRQRLLALLAETTPLETKYVFKIALGDMRIGVKESLVEEAIAQAYDTSPAEVRRATTLNGSLAEVVRLAAEGRLDDAEMKLFHPLGFMLASPVASVEEAMERFRAERRILERRIEERRILEGTPASGAEGSPGSPPGEEAGDAANLPDESKNQAHLEDKYDGIRAQIHCGDRGQSGRVAIFSRSRDEITASFPEIVEAFSGFSQPAILDGEIVAWDPAWDPAWNPACDPAWDPTPEGAAENEGRALPFTALQPRLGRQRASAAMREQAPVIFMAFDLLYADGELLLEQPLAARRRALEALAERERPRTIVSSTPSPASGSQQNALPFAVEPERTGFSRLLLAPAAPLESAEQLERAYWEARSRGNEGVMLKSLGSVYQPGKRGLAWLKLKRELATLDVVVTAAEYGHGKRAGWLSDYTFAVRDGDRLRNVGKAYSGLTDLEIESLTGFFREHTIEDFGFVRSVEPLVVLEVAFNNVMRSDRHDSGFALRFPRIVRIRTDKPVSEIDSLERVAGLYLSQERPVPPGDAKD